MILKIILVIVFVKILLDSFCIKEGLLDLDPPILSQIKTKDDEKTSSDSCNINIKFPNYDFEKNLYNNNNNYIYNNFSNILISADSTSCK
jgi:hypothetical protein